MNFNQLLNQILGTVQKTGKSAAQSPLNSFGGGALVGGIASMLLNKKNRKTITKVGSAAALGYLAYRGYQAWQQNKGGADVVQGDFQPAGAIGENYSRVILRTMIAAAASDGIIDEAEKQLIEKEAGENAEAAAWLAGEYRNPVTIEEIAAAVGNDGALAAEVYLAARLVCGDLSRKEIVFLSRLSAALGLDDNLVDSLEKQLDFV